MTEGFRSEIRESDGSLEATARVVDAGGDDDERIVEAALRPKRLAEFPGQPRVRDQLGLVLQAAKQRGSTPDHVLLSGPPGTGQDDVGDDHRPRDRRPLRISGPRDPARRRPGRDLSRLDRGRGVLPRRDPPDEPARRGDALPGDGGLPRRRHRRQGPGGHRDPARDCPRFTVVGATTRAGLLPAPLRDRFGFTGHLDYYDAADLETILHRSARLLGVDADGEGIAEIAGRSRGTPRIANRLLRRVRDWAQVHGSGRVDQVAALAALRLFDVDAAGLDRLDRAVLEALCRRFAGGPVGLSTLAVAVGEETDTVETVAEPYLVREGFMVRTPRGRAATRRAWEHLHLTPPVGSTTQDVLPLDDGPGRLGSATD
jgi:Holliday junction DNA helicase RuvB